MDGLIIKKKWLDLILKGKKTMEIRGNIPRSHLYIKIALIESGSGLIKGEAYIYSVVRLWKNGWFEKAQEYHRIPLKDKSIIKYKKCYGWWFTVPIVFETPIPYKHPQGAVIWVKDVL